jgi:hypothetical protein
MTEDSNTSGFVKAHLLREPLYAEERGLWQTLIQTRGEIAHFFRQVGQELVVNESDGLAYLRQIDPLDHERIPRISQRRRLGYEATLLLVFLRDELDRFERLPEATSPLFVTGEQMRDFASNFLRQTSDEKRDRRPIDGSIERLVEFGFLRRVPTDDERFEVKRIVKARLGPDQLEDIRDRLLKHASAKSS